MVRRFHCEFKSCNCNKFVVDCSNLCLNCKHANIWHSKKSKPPNDFYLALQSPREMARKPIYYRQKIFVDIFEPTVPPLPENDNEIIYCEAIEILPV
jgi:hypothetical protein